MTPGKFLRLIWPDTGFYCIAHPFKPANSDVTVYSHKVFATVSDAVTHVLEQKHLADTYFAMLSLREERIWDTEKTDWKTGAKGAWAVRKQENMLSAKCSFWDLDVGSEDHKYPTQLDALNDLKRFVEATQLPMPTMVSSGGGVHVYWPYTTTVPVEAWRTLALNLRQLGEALKLKVDPTRTTDTTSVLRVPGTLNWKNRDNPRVVEVLQEGAVTPFEVFAKLVQDALIRAGVVPGTPPPPRTGASPDNGGLGSNIQFNDFGPPPTIAEVGDACTQVREMLRAQTDKTHPHYGALDNTAWYRGMLGTIKHVEDGDNWCRKLTALHPRSTSDIEAKLLQLEQFPPAKCETLAQYMPWKDAPCQSCRFRLDPSVPNPIAAARRHTKAPPPLLQQLVAPSLALQAALAPPAPRPFERLKTGAIVYTSKDKDGNESQTEIYANDLYPLRRLVDSDNKTEQQLWRVHLPRVGAKEFLIDADVLYDSRKFCASLAHEGVYPNKAYISQLQDYMVAYISQLQKSHDADAQATHLGWTDEHRQFILPDKTLMHDGKVKSASLTVAAARAAQYVTKAGDLQAQSALMGFWNHPAYIPNQVAMLGSLGSILLYMTGHHGIVVNMSGDAGAAKSTTLYVAASFWGNPKLFPINGTQRGATVNARAQRIATNANLPTCVDEITHMPVKDVQDMVMNITQPGHRIRLQTDGVERATGDNAYKSAVMIASANSSLHALLSTDNAAGTAGSMRVFEMKFMAQRVHTKAEADEFLRQLEMHYGHIGEQFAAFVVQHRTLVEGRVQQLVREIDAEANITAAERFWSAYIAVVLVAAEIAQVLHLLPFADAPIRQWLVKQQIPAMRGTVKEEYRDPLAVLTDYIATAHGNILVVENSAMGSNTMGRAGGGVDFPSNNPHGALLGHYDMTTGMLYLLKQGFKDHCSKSGASSSRILEDLNVARTSGSEPPRRIVVERAIRRTLGAGTNLAKGQSWCFAVDMKHPDVSGVVKLDVVAGGVSQPRPPVGQLKAV